MKSEFGTNSFVASPPPLLEQIEVRAQDFVARNFLEVCVRFSSFYLEKTAANLLKYCLRFLQKLLLSPNNRELHSSWRISLVQGPTMIFTHHKSQVKSPKCTLGGKFIAISVWPPGSPWGFGKLNFCDLILSSAINQKYSLIKTHIIIIKGIEITDNRSSVAFNSLFNTHNNPFLPTVYYNKCTDWWYRKCLLSDHLIQAPLLSESNEPLAQRD